MILSSCSAVGLREWQEDCYLVLDSSVLAAEVISLLAVADGFAKGEAYPGDALSKQVIQNVLRYAPDIFPHQEKRFLTLLRRMFRFVDDNTQTKIAGSTLAVACVAESNRLYSACLGDSMVFAFRPTHNKDGVRLLAHNPDEHLEKNGQQLWGCFGDKRNRAYHSQVPEIQPTQGDEAIQLRAGDVVMVCSDGILFPPEPITPVERILTLAREYGAMACQGQSAQDLVQHALDNGTTDNVTVVLCQIE